MYILTIVYPNRADARFDFDYYRATHLPKVGEAFLPFGLGYASVLKGEQALDGSPPAALVTVILSFRTEEEAKQAMASPAAGVLAADLSNFTDIEPVFQFNTAVP